MRLHYDDAVGRPPKYDAVTMVDRAMDVFWVKGRRQTSIRDLEEALDMKAPSIHYRFADKDELFAACLARYRSRIVERRIAVHLPGRGDPIAELEAFFDTAVLPEKPGAGSGGEKGAVSDASDQLSSEPLAKSWVNVHGKAMAYHSSGPDSGGAGDADAGAVVFLHGNPTSSYLWRNIIPHVRPHARCVAPDLIGMGDSDKLESPGPESYRFVEHRHYLDGLLDQLELGDRVVLVVHDWGSALGFDWARRHPERVAGIAYMEAIVRPFPQWSDFSEAAVGVFQGFRSDAGEAMVIDRNLFVERVLPGSVLRQLGDVEMDRYRRPFTEPEHRRPTLTWPREIPIEGEPADVAAIVDEYGVWLSRSEVPKLFINAEPGAILTGGQREFCRTWPNQTEVTVSGSHFIQEDSPHEIGRAVVDWLRTAVGGAGR